jgi:hypothetical protein
MIINLLILCLPIHSCDIYKSHLYKIENSNGVKAVIYESEFDYFIEFCDKDGKKLLRKKVGLGVTESGISSFMWNENNCSEFALKISGDYNVVIIYIFDLDLKNVDIIEQPSKEVLPPRVKFTVNSGFNLNNDVNIEKYRIKNARNLKK